MKQRIRNILLEATAFKNRPNINENFRRWFGNSKMVDESGNPLVMYHGTDREFSRFSLDHFGERDWGYLGKGHYFTSDSKYASGYASFNLPFEDDEWDDATDVKERPQIMPVYLRVQNPYEMNENDEFEDSEEWAMELQRKGHDGVLVHSLAGRFWEVVVFDSTQIKSIFNQGTWNINNPDIMK
jgi:hypothetical protein